MPDTVPLSDTELDAVFARAKDAHVLVVGDFCLDHYLFLDDSLSEISIETGLATHAVRTHRVEPGGAGNVVANLCSLGARNIVTLGVLGDDLYGREYLRMFDQLGVDTSGMVIQSEGWSTGVFTKPYRETGEDARIDFGNANVLAEESTKKLLETFTRLLPAMDMVLINQQVMGSIHVPQFRSELTRILGQHPHAPVLIDPRDFADDFVGTMRKVTLADAEQLLRQSPSDAPETTGIETFAGDSERASAVAEKLYQRWERPTFVTMGEYGSMVCDAEGSHYVPAIQVTNRTDTVGAGDSVFAGLALALLADLSPERALLFGSHVAAVTVTKLLRTGTATEKELRDAADHPNFGHAMAIAEDSRRASFAEGSQIEVITARRTGEFRFALFDQDGTISTLRQGWEEVMEPVMLRAILGEHHDTVAPDIFDRVAHDVRSFIARTAGIQTLMQMHALAQMVREFGFVRREEVRDPLAYKQSYLEELDRIIAQRVARLARGELDSVDFTIKGARSFLDHLKQLGVTLFLASGTDDAAVRSEARLLGYDTLFDGGIFGAVDDLRHEPKRIVVDRILDQIGARNAHQLITFGDGPVEIQETRKRGGLCVGVASNEVRRFGLDLEKRRRLILAGAHYVVPDFSQFGALLQILTS